MTQTFKVEHRGWIISYNHLRSGYLHIWHVYAAGDDSTGIIQAERLQIISQDGEVWLSLAFIFSSCFWLILRRSMLHNPTKPAKSNMKLSCCRSFILNGCKTRTNRDMLYPTKRKFSLESNLANGNFAKLKLHLLLYF